MASNYEVNIKLNTRTVNKQLNNLEKRISKINKLAQGGRASRTVLQNEKHKINLATKRLQIENRNLRTKQRQLFIFTILCCRNFRDYFRSFTKEHDYRGTVCLERIFYVKRRKGRKSV